MNLLRWVGVVLALAAGAGIGLTMAETHRRRPRELAAFRTALHVLLSEIEVGLTPLPDALARAAQGAPDTVSRLLLEARRQLQAGSGITGGEAWSRAVEHAAPHLALDPEEIDILRGLSACLGGSSRDDHRRHLLLAITRLEGAERQAVQSWRQRHRLSVYLGVIGAAIVVLAMI